MSQRLEFIKACLNRTERITEICDRFGISEKTAHKWLQRFKQRGLAGLADRSHAPLRQPHRMSSEVEARLIALRRKYPLYGPQKLRDWLLQNEPSEHWPAASSIGDLLARAGLVRRRRRRQRSPERAELNAERTVASAANSVWTADFKGEFRLQSGAYCYALTVLDLHTHYLLGCSALTSTAVHSARQVFLRLFRDYGLPQVLRTDNGIPFAHPNALGRLGELGFWWVRLGIRPEHIKPSRPAENGAHERFHKTLKAAATRPPAASFSAQQRRFDRFRAEYNSQRPHQSLPAHCPPARLYACCAERPYPNKLPALIYPATASVRLVAASGYIKWQKQLIFLSSSLAGEYVSLTASETELVTIAYAQLALGEFDPRMKRFIPRVRWLA